MNNDICHLYRSPEIYFAKTQFNVTAAVGPVRFK